MKQPAMDVLKDFCKQLPELREAAESVWGDKPIYINDPKEPSRFRIEGDRSMQAPEHLAHLIYMVVDHRPLRYLEKHTKVAKEREECDE